MRKMILMVALVSLAGCQQETNHNYDIKEVAHKTYLINQNTGDLSIVSNDKVLQLPKYNLPQDKLLRINDSFEQKIQFQAITKQIEDRIYYSLNIEGYSSKITGKDGKVHTEVADFSWFKPALDKNKYDFIRLQFIDADGFKLAEETITLSKRYTNIVDYKGDTTGLIYEGSFKVNPILLSRAKNIKYVYKLKSLESAPVNN